MNSIRGEVHLLRILKDILRLIGISASRQSNRPFSVIKTVSAVLPDRLFKCPGRICVILFFEISFAGDVIQIAPLGRIGFSFLNFFVYRRLIDGPDGPVEIAGEVLRPGFLNIREQPNSSSRILGRLITDGKGAEYRGSTGQWLKVRYEGVEGFVHSNYARLEGLEKPQQAGRKVYYVVIGSFNDLNSAKEATRTLPDALDGSCIFRFTQDGKTVYRLCEGSYYSRAQAQGQADGIREYLERETWVLENDGVAPCFYQGVTPKGDAASILPK